MDQKTRPNLKEVLRLGPSGQFYSEHLDRWQQFKEQWSLEDKIRWQILLSRIHKKSNGTAEIKPPLSELEEQWARDLIRRAEALELC